MIMLAPRVSQIAKHISRGLYTNLKSVMYILLLDLKEKERVICVYIFLLFCFFFKKTKQNKKHAVLESNSSPNLLHSRYYGWMRFFPMWIFSCPKRRNHSDVSLVNAEACWSCDRNIKPFSYKGDIILVYRPRLGKTTTLCFVFVPPFESRFCSEHYDCATLHCPLQDRRWFCSATLYYLV